MKNSKKLSKSFSKDEITVETMSCSTCYEKCTCSGNFGSDAVSVGAQQQSQLLATASMWGGF